MNYAIYKTLEFTAKEINDSINNCIELDGIEVSMYADGWIVAEPSDLHVERWTRNKEDYRIESITVKSDKLIYDKIQIAQN